MVRSDASRSRSPKRPPKEELMFPDNQLGMSPSYFKNIGTDDADVELPPPDADVELPHPSVICISEREDQDDNVAAVLSDCSVAERHVRGTLSEFQLSKHVRALRLKHLRLLRLLMFFESLVEFERRNM